jgi:predicted nucleic acid-binding protein
VAVVLDSDAVVGFIDAADALHDAADKAIRDLAGKQSFVVSVVTYAEVVTGARIGHHDLDVAAGFFADVISRIVPVGIDIADRASELRAGTRSLRMPDALIVATAELDSEVDSLLTGDRAVGKLRGLGCDVQLLLPAG